MQTFLPFPDFSDTAKCLDYRRLGKQRVGAKQLLMVIKGETRAWANHPAAKMWINYDGALCRYALAICDEWTRRGYVDNLKRYFIENLEKSKNNMQPHFIGNKAFHVSHMSNLLRKNPIYYKEKFPPDTPINLPYIWPL